MNAKSLTKLFKTVSVLSPYMPLSNRFGLISNDHVQILNVFCDNLFPKSDAQIQLKSALGFKLKGDVEVRTGLNDVWVALSYGGLSVYPVFGHDKVRTIEIKKRGADDGMHDITVYADAFENMIGLKGFCITLMNTPEKHIVGIVRNTDGDIIGQSVVGEPKSCHNFYAKYDLQFFKKIAKLLPKKGTVTASLDTDCPICLKWSDEYEPINYEYFVAPLTTEDDILADEKQKDGALV